MKMPKRAPSTAASQSAPSKKMLGDLPPSSRVTRLRTIFPTAALPVNAILSTPGWATSAAPAVSPMPLTTLTTPGGRPSSSNQLATSITVSKTQGICWNWIDLAHNFVGEAGVVFETGCGIGDIVLGFDDGFAGIAAFQFGERSGIGANFLG